MQVSGMSYREMQSACKALGLPARGKAVKMKARLSKVEPTLIEKLQCKEDECVLQG